MKNSSETHAIRLEMIRFGSVSVWFLPHRFQTGILRFLAGLIRFRFGFKSLRNGLKPTQKEYEE
jgi:hypothetical protein